MNFKETHLQVQINRYQMSLFLRYKVVSSTPYHVDHEEEIESYCGYPSLVIQFV
jgi:hypothetical protein